MFKIVIQFIKKKILEIIMKIMRIMIKRMICFENKLNDILILVLIINYLCVQAGLALVHIAAETAQVDIEATFFQFKLYLSLVFYIFVTETLFKLITKLNFRFFFRALYYTLRLSYQ